MLYMVVERFRNGDWRAVGERFKRCGRMMPEGVEYVSSWMTPDGAACYQLMRAPTRASLDPWLGAWADLVDFEVVEVAESAAFWSGR